MKYVHTGIPHKDSSTLVLKSPDDGTWRDSANCRTLGVTAFFGTSISKASKKIIEETIDMCFKCPVRVECLRFAVDNDINYGIWGGMTATQRKQNIAEVSVMPLAQQS